MRVLLDEDRCEGHGRCYGLVPELFDTDDRGHCVLLHPQVPPELEGSARTGVDNCPEQALSTEP